MARYIDADKFIKQFERALEHQQKYGLYNHAKITQYVIKAIENEPTADVVPKREVFLASSDAMKMLIETHGYAVAHDADVKREVAREIFEEIEKTVFADMDFFKELKKKYTEEKHEN